jgi:hypothetical protein
MLPGNRVRGRSRLGVRRSFSLPRAVPTNKIDVAVAQTAAFRRSAAFRQGTHQLPQTCQETASLRYRVLLHRSQASLGCTLMPSQCVHDEAAASSVPLHFLKNVQSPAPAFASGRRITYAS